MAVLTNNSFDVRSARQLFLDWGLATLCSVIPCIQAWVINLQQHYFSITYMTRSAIIYRRGRLREDLEMVCAGSRFSLPFLLLPNRALLLLYTCCMLRLMPTSLPYYSGKTCVECLGTRSPKLYDAYSISLLQGPADTAVEEVHSVLRQIVARTIESEDCKGLAQFTLLKREIATTAAAALEKMKDDARKMVQTMVEMESSYLTAEVFKEILQQSSNPESGDILRTLSGRPVSPWLVHGTSTLLVIHKYLLTSSFSLLLAQAICA